ncbi:Bifunctional epoxide hydrolase 2 [Hondaea fermentalgiana]|uniref:Bifunctional epoxide hydrolase 2 n=1 Tax=Hondaea fermentalgiana TaxID=2315210 RepID=A0A2R5GTF9_9STRA|nr:Bifunctional epoxide hydrolase 2 [Hondaea fermentalgiana]|eukprot:GBG33038.1 Bifunctional epoxide hydrolase 2 [Hondaea fermentalgiana]
MATLNGKRAVVFDLGGVVLGSPLQGIAEHEKEFGIADGFVNISIVQRGRQGAFERLERGELPLDDFYRVFREELGSPEAMEQFKAYLTKKGKPVPPNLPASYDIDTEKMFGTMMSCAAQVNRDMCHALFVLRGLGLKVCALTNNWKMGGDDDSSSTKILRAFFDHILESSELGLRKPDERIYRHTEKVLGVSSEEICFLDDIGTNVKAARKIGWTTVKVELGNKLKAIRELAVALGLPEDTLLIHNDRPTKLQLPVSAAGNLVCDLYGSATDPIVIFLHGGGQTRHTWERSAAAFVAEGFCALLVDMKGHGESDWDERPGVDDNERYAVRSYAEDLDRLVAFFTLNEHPRGFAIVGASLGGIATLSTDRARHEAAAIVLVDIVPRMQPEGVHRVLSWMKETGEAGFDTLDEAADAIAAYNPTRTPRPREDVLAGLQKNLRRTPTGRWKWHWDPKFVGSQKPANADLEAYHSRIQAHAKDTQTPCLLVRGRETDLVSESAAEEFVQIMPNARFVNVEKAAHMVVGDRNDVFASEALSFLRAHLAPELASPTAKL